MSLIATALESADETRAIEFGELDELRGRRLAVSRVVGGAVVVHGQRETLVDELAAAFQNFVRRREAGFELEHDERRRKRFDQLAQQEDKQAIFDEWCSFINFFDSSVKFELSFVNMSTDAEAFANQVAGLAWSGLRGISP